MSMSSRREQGGAYAIRGFLYQFDHTIKEIIDNPTVTVEIEKAEDIMREQRYVQVKYRSTAKCTPSRLRHATKQLLLLFLEDSSRHFCLICYFPDRNPSRWRPSANEVAQILGSSESNKYAPNELRAFSSHFQVQFSYDYLLLFDHVLEAIKGAFSLKSIELAVLYHAIIRSHLLDLAISRLDHRTTSLEALKLLVGKASVRITMHGYEHLLEEKKYINLLRKMYFMPRRPNIDAFERLFIIEFDGSATTTDAIELLAVLSKRYFKPGKSPPPYVLFLGLDLDALTEAKRAFVDKGNFINDGTCFDGDRLRTKVLLRASSGPTQGQVKPISKQSLTEKDLLAALDEVYQFFISDPIEIPGYDKRHIQVSISSTKQALMVLR